MICLAQDGDQWWAFINTNDFLSFNEIRELLNYLLTYLTPSSRVILEKLIGLQLVKKFPAFYGTRRFITAFISARHLSLS
jgi:hypothetical protein